MSEIPKRNQNGTTPPERCPMANLTIKNMPDELHEQLKQRAAENHRSLNQEVIFCLTLELMRAKRTAQEEEELLARIDEHLEKLAKKGVWIPSDEWLEDAINEGRD